MKYGLKLQQKASKTSSNGVCIAKEGLKIKGGRKMEEGPFSSSNLLENLLTLKFECNIKERVVQLNKVMTNLRNAKLRYIDF